MMSDPSEEVYRFQRYVRQVATATMAYGMTASKIDTYAFLQPVDAWGFPKYPGKTVILPAEADLIQALASFITTNGVFLSEADAWLGTWINPNTQHCYLDITTSRTSLEEARWVATEIGAQQGRRIVALYNSLHDQTAYL